MAKIKQPKRDAALKVPKRIAGVKVPKELRRTAERAIDTVVEQANSPRGREVIAAGLSMAAAAATAAMVRARENQRGADAGTPPVPPVPPVPPRTAGTADGQAVADAVGQAAEMMLGRLFGTRRA